MKKEKNIFFIILVICLGSCFLWGFLYWLIRDGQRLPEGDSSSETLFTASSLETLKVSLGSFSSQIETIEGQFIDKEMTVELIEEVEAAARQAGVALRVTGAQDTPDVVIGYTGEGSFRGLMQFQMLVENLPRKLFFNKFAIHKKSATGASEDWLLDASIKLESVR